jgi:hypothetical protein
MMIFLLGLTILSCGEKSENSATKARPELQGSEAGSIRDILITPDNPTPLTGLEAKVLFRGKEPERLSYQWLKNGSPIPGAIRPVLSSGQHRKGDFVSVEVQASYPGGGMDRSVSDVVVIGNTPPVVRRISITPNPATSSDTLQAVVETTDQDGDQVSLIYEWTVDGETMVGQDDASLASQYFRRGNTVQVAATPQDGLEAGNTRVSDEVVIQNSAPRIVSVPPERAEEGLYRYSVQAEDPDGDPLRFSLGGELPDGMEIDSETGMVQWQVVVPDNEVTYHYEVVAEDSAGAKSIQKITLSNAPAGDQPPEG